MATVKKVVKKTVKKAQYGTSTSMDSKGRYNVVTKSNTPEGPRYYQYAHPNESTATMFNAARARANSADSIPAAKVHPLDIKKLANQRNGGKVSKAKKMAKGGMLKRADGSYSKRGLWDNIRAAKGSGKKPTAAMLKQEKKIKAKSKK
jgi:hypothetical protein